MAGFYAVGFNLASSGFAPATSFYTPFLKPSLKVSVHQDGDFSEAKPCGAAVPEHPFIKHGDRNHTIIRQPFVQDMIRYQPQELGTYLPGDNRFLLVDECDWQDIGGRLMKWTRVYATVPSSHDRWGNRSHPYQYISSRTPLKVSDKPIPVLCRSLYEFFLVGQVRAYPPLAAARFETMTDILTLRRGSTAWNLFGDLFVTDAAEIVAEDSEIGCYMGPIHYRRTPYVPGPTVALWGETYTLPGT